jgi:N-acetylglutamate synthase and related acetyltransferases
VTQAEQWTIRRARTSDIRAIASLIEPLVESRVLLGKDLVVLYEAVQEFTVATRESGEVVGCGALHVFWENLGEIRTLAVSPDHLGKGIGTAVVAALEEQARELGISTLFCLTFEVDFFQHHGFHLQGEQIVDPEIYLELVRSPDEGVAEFLDLARVKPNTLGNSRLVKDLG